MYLNQPREIGLETISLCNAKCSFCPYPDLERTGKMSDDLIDKVIREMQEFREPFFFAPFKVNEPLLDKRLFDICQRVENETIARLRLFTNGSPLTQTKINQLKRLKRVEHLWISLNSHDPDEYRALMDLDFDKTAKRLDKLHQQEFPHPVVLSRVGVDKDFKSYCRGRWPKFQSFIIKKDAWLGYTEADMTEVPNTPCGRWLELSIMSTGVVSLCCMDGEGQFPIGDINTQTLLEVYNAPFWRIRREQSLSRHEVPVCKTCTY